MSSTNPTPSDPYPLIAVKNGKYVVFGLLAAKHLGVLELLSGVLRTGRDGQGRVGGLAVRAIQLASLLTILILGLFLYLVLYLPRIKGIVPNYSAWQRTPPLQTIVPLLTLSILSSYSLFVFGLSSLTVPSARGGDPSILGAIAGSMGLFAAGFGLIGLIPTPKPARPARLD